MNQLADDVSKLEAALGLKVRFSESNDDSDRQSSDEGIT
jgi:hypothetical protein